MDDKGSGSHCEHGNSFANGACEGGPLTGKMKLLGWEYITQGKTVSTTIYDLGA